MNNKRIANELSRIADSIDDKMEKEKLSKLFVMFHAWATEVIDSRPSTAPIVSQILNSMAVVKKKLKNKMNLTGREAVEAMLDAMQGHFTEIAKPIPYLQRKYGRDIGGLLYNYDI